jgi:hypothetical protein
MSKKTGESDCFAFEQELTLMKKYFFSILLWGDYFDKTKRESIQIFEFQLNSHFRCRIIYFRTTLFLSLDLQK